MYLSGRVAPKIESKFSSAIQMQMFWGGFLFVFLGGRFAKITIGKYEEELKVLVFKKYFFVEI